MKKADLLIILSAVITATIIFLGIRGFMGLQVLQKTSTTPHVVPKQDESVVHLVLVGDLEVTIDGQNALINQTGHVDHCNWDFFEIAVKNGSHELKIKNNKTKVSSERAFIVNNDMGFYIYYSTSGLIHIEQTGKDFPYRCL